MAIHHLPVRSDVVVVAVLDIVRKPTLIESRFISTRGVGDVRLSKAEADVIAAYRLVDGVRYVAAQICSDGLFGEDYATHRIARRRTSLANNCTKYTEHR